jgi:hypothetical protein
MADLRAAAAQSDAPSAEQLAATLTDLRRRHLGLEGLFWVLPSGWIAAAAPAASASLGGQHIAGQAATRWIDPGQGAAFSHAFRAAAGTALVGVQVPAERDGRPVATLAALLRVDRAIPAVLPPAAAVSGQRPDVWSAEGGGLVLYDEDPKYVGTNLFRDPINLESPAVVEFGRRMQAEDIGVSHYTYLLDDGRRQVHKVAAWYSLQPSPGVTWKLVVDYPYVIRRD